MTKLLQAIEFATKKHLGQVRKDGKTPYISHPLAVALIVARETDDEEVVIAAVLHDTLEDTDTTPDELDFLFGPRVTKLVEELTLKPEEEVSRDLKLETINRIKDLSSEAALIKCADILHNKVSLTGDIKLYGKEFLNNFLTKGDDKIFFEKKRLSEMKKYHENKLIGAIEDCLRDLDALLAQ